MSIPDRFNKDSYNPDYAPYNASELAQEMTLKPRFFRREQASRNGFFHPHRNYLIRYISKRIIPIKDLTAEADRFI